ncbi:MAG: glycosyltransferase family 39 protein [Flavobacteriaceae bacterium]|nr:glycosyltransferase family 39 protein [Flavobacteriaceae bacterium]
MKLGKRKYLIGLLLACAAIFLSNLAVLHVNIMEARNFITAREMIVDGNWLLTTLNGYPRYQKPPLPTWITAFFAMIFGLKSLIALRLPAALMAILLVITSYKFVTRLTQNKYFAFISGLIMATSFYIVSAGRDANWDIYTHGFMMVCIYQLYLFFTSNEKKYQRVLIAALFFGCSFMSKGPVSLYALLLPFLISFGIVYKYRDFKSRIVPILLFLVVSLLLSGWWHWYTYTFDPETVAAITKKETSNWTGYNVRPFYYYWSFFTQSGVWTLPAFIGLLYPYLKNRVFDKKAYLFTFLWTMGSVVLLSIIPEKKSRYLLPVLIPMAMNTAFYIEYLFRSFAELQDKRQTIPVYFNFGLIASIGIVFPIGGYLFLKDNLAGQWLWFALLSIALFSIGFLMFKHLIKKRMVPVFFLTIIFIASILCFGMPMARALTVNPEFKGLSKLNDWQQETELPVYEYAGFTPELIWDYGKPIEVLKQEGIVKVPSESSFGLLVPEEHLNEFRNSFPDYSIEKVTRYDMNPKGPGERSHRPRLWRDLYKVTKN